MKTPPSPSFCNSAGHIAFFMDSCIRKRQAYPEGLASEVKEQAFLSRVRLIEKGKVLNSQPNPQLRVSNREKWNQRPRELTLSQVEGRRCFRAKQSKCSLETQTQTNSWPTKWLPNTGPQTLLVKWREWCQCTNELERVVNTKCLLELHNTLQQRYYPGTRRGKTIK